MTARVPTIITVGTRMRQTQRTRRPRGEDEDRRGREDARRRQGAYLGRAGDWWQTSEISS